MTCFIQYTYASMGPTRNFVEVSFYVSVRLSINLRDQRAEDRISSYILFLEGGESR